MVPMGLRFEFCMCDIQFLCVLNELINVAENKRELPITESHF